MAKAKSHSVVAVDLGNHSLKIIEATRTKDKLAVQQAIIAPVAEDQVDNLTLLLKPYKESLTASKHVRMVFSGSSALVRCVPMPVMTQSELKSAIRFEAENHIAFPIDDCILDFQILNQVPEKKVMNVLIVAAKRDFIQERLKMLFDLEIRPEIIDVDTFALVNAYETLAVPPAEEKTFGLLNIGHRVTSFAIVQDKLPLFVREIPMGGASITKALAEAKGLGEAEAEGVKVAHTEDAAAELKAATVKGLETLIEQLKNSIQYYENEAGETIKSVWLSGGGALAMGALETLSEGLGKPVAFWDCMKKIDAGAGKQTLEQNAAVFHVALGMAVRP